MPSNLLSTETRLVIILCGPCNMSIFTARRYAKRGICRRRVSVRFCVCVCVCVSVTVWYCIKTAKRRITQMMPHNWPGTLVFKWDVL